MRFPIETDRNRSSRLRVAALWSLAALTVVSAHAGALAVMLRQDVAAPVEDAGAPAMEIDLAALPQTLNADRNSLSDQLQDATEAPAETLPEPRPEETPAAAPEAQTEPEPDPLPDPVPAEVALPKPETKPETPPALPRKPEVRKTEAKTAAPPPSKAANRAAAEVAPSARSVSNRLAPAPAPQASPAAVASWQSRLFAHLERNKRYPAAARARGIQGTLKFRFTIDPAGNVLNVQILQSSGQPMLDEALLDLMNRASPVPAPPPGTPLSIVTSIRYALR